MANSEEVWQVEVNGQIYETNLAELALWVDEGSLIPQDKVRRGNLRWLEAGKIPLLYGFFNAKERGVPISVSPTTVDLPAIVEKAAAQPENFAAAPSVLQNHSTAQLVALKSENSVQTFQAEKQTFVPAPQTVNDAPGFCVIHAEAESKFVCLTCASAFCPQCPKSFGGNVKICPLCGAMCRAINELKAKHEKIALHQHSISEKFGFADFGRALAYPFKYKTSFIFGAVMFMFFTLGQSASGVGGTVMLAAAIFCAMMANALTFGVLANTVDNFAQGKTDTNFMPSFDDFSLWDDVIHPFFLSLGVYFVSFGLLIIIGLGALWYAWDSMNAGNDLIEQKSVSTVMPDAAGDLNSAKQIPQIEQIKKQLNENNQWKNGQIPDANQIEQTQNNPANAKADDFQNLEEMMRQNQKKQLESMVGKSLAEERAAFKQMALSFVQTAKIFLVPMFLALLWALFYFPAACCVAGYTRSFTATLNPSVGLDTIKHLGADYAKILAMATVLIVVSLIAGAILSLVFSPFDLPRLGNMPAKAVGSLLTFYLSIVFSALLGFALYKNSERLNLYRG